VVDRAPWRDTDFPAAALAAAPSFATAERAADQRRWPLPAAPALALRPALTAAQRHQRLVVDALRGTGGLLSAELVCAVLRRRCDQPISLLARWIVGREVLSLDWQGQTWLPMFQFQGPSLVLRPALRPVLADLGDVFDSWELLEWFTQPNGWLHGALPAQAIASDPAAVAEAARADRFVARGD